MTEVHYNPADPTAAEAALGYDNNNDFEFIELANIGSQTVSLIGVELSLETIDNDEQGVSFEFGAGPITELAPGTRLVVVEDAAAFAARYGNEIPSRRPVVGWIGE